MNRWMTGEEIHELFHRCKWLIDNHGEDRDDESTTARCWSNIELMISVKLDRNGMLYVEDSTAGVMVADYETGGIREVFGGSATPLLRRLQAADHHPRAGLFLEPPHFADPKKEPWRTQIALAGLKSGHEGTFKLALQLAGVKICDQCDYVLPHCRCEDNDGNTEDRG